MQCNISDPSPASAEHAPPQAASLADAQVQLYHCKTDTTAGATLPLAAVLRDIREGRWRLQVDACRGIYVHGTTAAYHAAKGRLPAVTFGGTFSPHHTNAHLVVHSGVVLADIDHTAEPQTLKAQLVQDPQVALAFLSASGYGLKVGVRVAPVPDAAAYRHAWEVVASYYERQTGVPWDPAASAVCGLCFVSFDAALHWTPNAVPFPIPAMPAPTTEQPTPQAGRTARQQGDSHASTAAQRYAQHALKTAVTLILRSQPGEKHHTRLRAARLVGGHIATGVLDYETAWTALHAAVVATTDNLPNAERTLWDGLTYGRLEPISGPQVDAVATDIAGVHDDGTLPEARLTAAPHPSNRPQGFHRSRRPPRPVDRPDYVGPWLGRRSAWHGINVASIQRRSSGGQKHTEAPDIPL